MIRQFWGMQMAKIFIFLSAYQPFVEGIYEIKVAKITIHAKKTTFETHL